MPVFCMNRGDERGSLTSFSVFLDKTFYWFLIGNNAVNKKISALISVSIVFFNISKLGSFGSSPDTTGLIEAGVIEFNVVGKLLYE